ncbi:MAG: hypothetical protein ABI679_09880 [Gemmatimonadota bacterium]
MTRKILLVLGLMLGTAGALSAQLTVTGLRNLAFGSVIKGIPSSVTPSDPVKSGQFEFITPIGSNVRIQFTLPTRLNGPAGSKLTISFGTTDAIALGQGPTSQPVTFNPNTAQTFNIVSSNRIWVFLGGRVTPTANQTTGSYTNTVTLTVTIL